MTRTALDHARRKTYVWRLGAYLDDAELVRHFKQQALDEDLGYTELLVKMMRFYFAHNGDQEVPVMTDPRML